MNPSNTERFSNRVNDYVKYRPGYPDEMLSYLEKEFGFHSSMTIADIGAGTGISAEIFLKADYTVIAVEPNQPMREKAIELLNHFQLFSATDGSAEETKLPDHSADAIISAQAFHWFDREKSKKEFIRTLKPGSTAVFIWNERLTSSSFENEYDRLIIKHARDYVKVDHRNIDDAAMKAFFAPQHCSIKSFPNKQDFDFDGLKGRLLSSSYMPSKEDDGYEEMMEDLELLFSKYQQNGMIRINYETKLYAGKLTADQ